MIGLPANRIEQFHRCHLVRGKIDVAFRLLATTDEVTVEIPEAHLAASVVHLDEVDVHCHQRLLLVAARQPALHVEEIGWRHLAHVDRDVVRQSRQSVVAVHEIVGACKGKPEFAQPGHAGKQRAGRTRATLFVPGNLQHGVAPWQAGQRRVVDDPDTHRQEHQTLHEEGLQPRLRELPKQDITEKLPRRSLPLVGVQRSVPLHGEFIRNHALFAIEYRPMPQIRLAFRPADIGPAHIGDGDFGHRRDLGRRVPGLRAKKRQQASEHRFPPLPGVLLSFPRAITRAAQGV